MSKRSRSVRSAIKFGHLDVIDRSIQKLHEQGAAFAGFLGPDVVLVPAPRSAPLKDPNALWPAQRIFARLVEAGLGREVLPCLRRTAAVPKSAFAPIGERPDVGRHPETMAVERSLLSATRITVVDDIVTKGATLLAAASRIAEAFGSADVRAFALLRTMGLIHEIDRIVSPCSGTIYFQHGDVLREP